jgi:enamine deaminase RidA (YjgF/YER057c/UK114 family)
MRRGPCASAVTVLFFVMKMMKQRDSFELKGDRLMQGTANTLTRVVRHMMLATLMAAPCASVAFAQLPSSTPTPAPAPAASQGPPSAVTFYGDPKAVISGGVAIPAGAAIYLLSGTVPPVIDQQAKPDDRARYGVDTKTQAIGIFKTMEKQLGERGLTLKDVVYIRAFLVGDSNKGGKLDLEGWNDAYKQYFGTTENPNKTARATIGVAALVSPLFLLEVEAVAVYPTKPASR